MITDGNCSKGGGSALLRATRSLCQRDPPASITHKVSNNGYPTKGVEPDRAFEISVMPAQGICLSELIAARI